MQAAKQKVLTYCWTSPNTSAQVSPQLQDQRQHPNITDRPKTQRQTFLASRAHQEEVFLGKQSTLRRTFDKSDYEEIQMFQLLGPVMAFKHLNAANVLT